jgi:guanine nucleotide-binding protein G(i) subunit alpha
MADPLTIIGTGSSVVGIIEVLAKTMSRLGELKERWKQADFTFINLIAQLSALKAALNKLQGWIDSDVDETRHLLVMDLEVSITCCRTLIDKINAEVSNLYRVADNGLSSQGKLKLVLKNGTLEGLQKMVERQTNALTLLLTVCNW